LKVTVKLLPSPQAYPKLAKSLLKELPMKISLHPNAIQAFNKDGLEVVANIVRRSINKTKTTFKPDVYISHTIGTEDIKKFIAVDKELNGRVISRFIGKNNENIGLEREFYYKMQSLAESIHKRSEIRLHVSIEFLENSIFDWAIDYFLKETTLSLIDYIIPKIEQEVINLTITIPVFGLSVEEPFSLGRVKFQPLDSSFFDNWLSAFDLFPDPSDNFQKQALDFKAQVQSFRQQLQGSSACVIELEAELNHARKVAMEETENALTLLYIFFPTILHPDTPSIYRPFGKQSIGPDFIIHTDKSHNLPLWSRSLTIPFKQMLLSKMKLEEMQNLGLNKLNSLYLKDNRSSFEDDLLRSIFIYSRSSLRQDPSDRLIFVFTALDSFLLKDANESIQQNISERMAFLIGDTAQKRIRIVGVIKKAYEFRSKAIHHDISVRDREIYIEFLSYVFIFFLTLIKNSHNFQTKQDLYKLLDERKFS
jgi:hypothetical protein